MQVSLLPLVPFMPLTDNAFSDQFEWKPQSDSKCLMNTVLIEKQWHKQRWALATEKEDKGPEMHKEWSPLSVLYSFSDMTVWGCHCVCLDHIAVALMSINRVRAK